MQTSEKGRQTVKTQASENERRDGGGKPVSILHTTVHPLPRPLPEKLFLMSKWQRLKCLNVLCRRVSHALTLCFLFVCAKWLTWYIDVNCQNWPIIGYTRKWYTRMRNWKRCSQVPLTYLSQPLAVFTQLFFMHFPNSFGASLAKSLPESVTSLVDISYLTRVSSEMSCEIRHGPHATAHLWLTGLDWIISKHNFSDWIKGTYVKLAINLQKILARCFQMSVLLPLKNCKQMFWGHVKTLQSVDRLLIHWWFLLDNPHQKSAGKK